MTITKNKMSVEEMMVMAKSYEAWFAKGRKIGHEEIFHLLDLARKECAAAFSRGLEEGAKVAEKHNNHCGKDIAAAIRSLEDKP